MVAKTKGSLAGKHALVTGASRGLGAEIAKRLLGLGAVVTLTARKFDEEFLSFKSIGATSEALRIVEADLSSGEDREKLIRTVVEDGSLDILVNNAGRFEAVSLLGAEQQVARQLFEIDFWAPIELVRHASAALRQSQGAVVNISSVSGTLSNPSAGVYCAVKAALEMATRCLARELAPDGVRVNAVAPGPVPTQLLNAALEGESPDFMLNHIPLGRLGTPCDIADAVVWLVSNEASWITGQILRVDGGMTI